MIKNLPQQCHDDLSRLFKTQIAELRVISQYLLRIKIAVAENSVEQLNDLLAGQKIPVTEIENLQTQRLTLMSNYKFEASDAGVQKCIDWCDHEGKLAHQYQVFKDELQLLQQSLQISNLLLSKGQSRVRQSLHLLTGQTVNARIYTSSGQSQDSTDRRSIAHV